MLVDAFIDMEEDAGQLWLSAWRCVNCGQISDPGVIKNRVAPRVVEADPNALARRRPRRRLARTFPTALPMRLTA
jgi:hypothetical protein